MLSKKYVVFFAIVAVAIVAVVLRNTEMLSAKSEHIIKSPNDQRQYQAKTLENGLQVLLVSDPASTKAAAAMSVNVGSGSDPKAYLGLAHFLEHMLFLGTDAYPEAGEYQDFINKHGGEHNAFTAYDRTLYYFSVENEALTGALDRFAPFFISPKFDPQYVEREINAIEAEYSSKSKDDQRRIYSALKQAMNPEHSYSQFSTGNLMTLSQHGDEQLREQLLSLYKKEYNANNMQLVLVANQPLEQLSQLADQYFTQVPMQSASVNTTEPKKVELFVSDQLPLDLQIKPNKEIRQLQFIFQMPEIISQYRFKPLNMLGHLIGHEGQGSLLKYYKQQGWVETLSAGKSISNPTESTFTIKMQLTEKGMQAIDTISQALFIYIDVLKQEYQLQQMLPEYIIEEQNNLYRLAFQFQEQSSAQHLAIQLASSMNRLPIEDIIYGNYRLEQADKGYLTPYLDRLSSNNLVRVLIAPEVTTSTVDPWYQTEISLLPANKASLDKLDNKSVLPESFHLPKANPFIPQDFSLSADTQQDIPALIVDQASAKLWYYPEHHYKTPKAQVFINLFQQKIADSAKQQMIAELFSHAVNENLNSYSYPAYVAGINYRLAASNRGIELVLSGYHDKLEVLLQAVIDQMQNNQVDQPAFDRYKQKIERQLNNRLKAKPYEREIDLLRRTLRQPAFNEQDYLAALSDITLQDVNSFNQQLKQSIYLQAYVHGTVSKEKALNIFSLIEKNYPTTAAPVLRHKIIKIKGSQQLTLDSSHPDQAIVWYWQADQSDATSDRSRAKYALLAQMINSAYYTQLRTEQKLGYIVSASNFPQQETPGLIFIIQSPKNSVAELVKASQDFWQQQFAVVKASSEQEFAEYKKGLINKLLEPQTNMGQLAYKYWFEINRQRLNFSSSEDIAEQVKTLTLADISELYQQVFLSDMKTNLLINTVQQDKKAFTVFDLAEKQTLPTW